MLRARNLILAVLFVTTAVSSPARANGRFPAMRSAHWQPGGDDLLLGATFGGVLSKDGGQTYGWMCEQAIGYGGFFDPELGISANGTLFATTFDGLARSEDGGCSWGYAFGDLLGYWVDGLALHPTNAMIVFASTSSGGKINGIMKSTDGGRSFTTVPGASSNLQFWKSIKFAPGDAMRIYATSYTASPETLTTWVSRNGGTSFTPVLFNQPFETGGGDRFKILAISPTNPDILFAQTLEDVTAGEAPFAVWRSPDAGATWTQVFSTLEEIRGIEVAPGGMNVLLATAPSGMFRSTNAGLAFTRVPAATDGGGPPQIACLAARGAELYGCGNNFSDKFAFGKSPDYGASTTWMKVFSFKDIGGVMPGCTTTAVATWLPNPASPMSSMSSRNLRELCDPLWPGLAVQLGITSAVDDGGMIMPTTDSGTVTKPPGDDGPCGCRVGRRTASAFAGGMLACAALVFAIQLIRRRK